MNQFSISIGYPLETLRAAGDLGNSRPRQVRFVNEVQFEALEKSGAPVQAPGHAWTCWTYSLELGEGEHALSLLSLHR